MQQWASGKRLRVVSVIRSVILLRHRIKEHRRAQISTLLSINNDTIERENAKQPAHCTRLHTHSSNIMLFCFQSVGHFVESCYQKSEVNWNSGILPLVYNAAIIIVRNASLAELF